VDGCVRVSAAHGQLIRDVDLLGRLLDQNAGGGDACSGLGLAFSTTTSSPRIAAVRAATSPAKLAPTITRSQLSARGCMGIPWCCLFGESYRSGSRPAA
jgi:hypothetical protein